jgi:NADH-quinone oxidoreductase subunit A
MPILVQTLATVAANAFQAAEAEAVPTTFDIVFPLTVLVLIGLAIPGGMMLANHLLSRWALGKGTGNPGKDQPVESGLDAVVGSANERFSVKFYLVAMLFLAFDLEVAFLYPWAANFGASRGWSMIALLVPFLIMLEVGYLYLFKKGALDWEE